LEHRTGGEDFVFAALHGGLSEHHSMLAGEGGDDVQGRAFATPTYSRRCARWDC
jgi:hypothetical protein